MDMEIFDIRKHKVLEDEITPEGDRGGTAPGYPCAEGGRLKKKFFAPPALRGCGCDCPGDRDQRATDLPLDRNAPMDIPVPWQATG